MLDRDFYPASKSWSASLQLVRTSPRHLIPPPPACPKRSKLEFQPFGALWFVLFWTFQLWDPFCGRFSHFLSITSKPHRISNELLDPPCCFYLFTCFSQKYYDLLTSDKTWMSRKLRSVLIQNVKMFSPISPNDGSALWARATFKEVPAKKCRRHSGVSAQIAHTEFGQIWPQLEQVRQWIWSNLT